jgi:hypothetical protein
MMDIGIRLYQGKPKKKVGHQSLIGSVVIEAEFYREDYSSISRNYDHEEIETT